MSEILTDDQKSLPNREGSLDPTMFEMVGAFREKFGLQAPHDPRLPPLPPTLLDDAEFLHRLHLIMEETHELVVGHQTRNLPKLADALGDMLYVVLGMGHCARIDLDRIFSEIHRANMSKVRAADVNNARGSTLDVVKPPGWQPPNIEQVLADQGWIND